MIDEEKTFREKGYRSTDLKPQSHKDVWAVCEGENCEREGGRGRWIMFYAYGKLCRKCANKKNDLLKQEDRTEKLDYIDDDITFAEKGYKSTWLKPNSKNMVWAICQGENCEREGGRGRWVRFDAHSKMCRACANKTDERRKKVGDAHRNKIVPDKTKKLISENHADVSGENHPNWQGGITDERHKFYTSREYNMWRKDVFERDDYTCQECGLRGVVLNTHHILPYRDWKEPRFSLNVKNGITLCEDCHKETFGREYEFFNKYFDIANGITEGYRRD